MTQRTIIVNVKRDRVLERTETLAATIAGARNAIVSTGVATGIIRNDNTTVTAGDMNGDGGAEIVWRSQAGEFVTWQMASGAVAGVTVHSNPGSYWGVAATSDFYGDGTADILWRGQGNEVALWQMNGGCRSIRHPAQ